MPAEQKFTSLKKCRFNAETELIKARLIKRLKPFLNTKLAYMERSCFCSCISLRGAVQKRQKLSLLVYKFKIYIIFRILKSVLSICPDEVLEGGRKALVFM